MRWFNGPGWMFGAVAVASLWGAGWSEAADHLEAPGVMGEGAVDLNDLYVFQSPNNPDNAVLALTVNPFAGNVSGTEFRSGNTSYEFRIDNDGDNQTDVTYSATFGAAVGGSQSFSLQRTAGGITSISLPGQTGMNEMFGNIQARAGLFDDPFFFDLNGFNNGFAFTGDDTFAGANVSGIVLELPASDFTAGSNNVGIYAATVVNGNQFDRVGRPAINTALVSDDDGDEDTKDSFNAGQPSTDVAEFSDEINESLVSLSNQQNADALTPVLLPDVLTFDVTSDAGFGALNGRRLDDDVIDTVLTLVTGGFTGTASVTTDMVDANDVPFQDVFPYLAPAQVAAVPEPASMAMLGMIGLGVCGRRRWRRGATNRSSRDNEAN